MISYLEKIFNRENLVTTKILDVLGLMFADDVSCSADSVINLQRVLNESELICKSVRIYINFDNNQNNGIQKWRPAEARSEMVL